MPVPLVRNQNSTFKDDNMRIQVIYFDNTPGVVDSDRLDDLIDSRSIIAFRRSEGWVRVNGDPVRGKGGKYKGPDRRGR
jgi:hypothetical protein